MLVALALFAKPIAILFLGNSFVAGNDLPGMVRSLCQSDSVRHQVTTKYIACGHLEDIAKDPSTRRELSSGAYSVIVLQSAMVSSSHKYKYSQAGGIALARLAVKTGAKTYLFVEWPRRSWKETEYTIDVYREIATASGATIIPVARLWDQVLAKAPKAPMWMPDGNHADVAGTYLAACAIHAATDSFDHKPTWSPAISGDLTSLIRSTVASPSAWLRRRTN